MNNVVSVRIDKINYSQTLGQLSHDIRKEIPDYLRRDEINKIYIFKDEDRERATPLKFSKNDTSIVDDKYTEINNNLDKVKKDIQDDYKKHHGKKLSHLTKEFITGVITFGVDDALKAIRENELKENLSLTTDEVENINSIDKSKLDKCAYDFLMQFAKQYGSKPIYLVRHDDEKTTHYHFTTTHYNFDTHKTITSNFKYKDIQQIGSNLQDMVANNFQPLDFIRGKKSSKPRQHLKVSQMHQQEQDELLVSNKALLVKNDTYKLELEKKLQENKDLVTQLKVKREEVKNSDLDLINKKEQYEFISQKQTEARTIIKELYSQIKDLRESKKTVEIEQQTLEDNLSSKVDSTLQSNLKKTKDGKTIVSDTSKLKKDILEDLKDISKFDYNSSKEIELQKEVDELNKKLVSTSNELTTTKATLKDTIVTGKELYTNHEELKTKYNNANSEILQLKDDIKQLETMHKFDYQTFKKNRKSLFQKNKEAKEQSKIDKLQSTKVDEVVENDREL